MKVGEVMVQFGEIELNQGRDRKTLVVANAGDRPIQVGSHYHFFEVNRLLTFDRKASYGYRLDIPSGTSVRFEPGQEKEVTLVALGGTKRVFGLNDLTRNQASEQTLLASVDIAKNKGFIKEDI